MAKIWYSFLGTHPKDDIISFYNPKDFVWAKHLENHWETIAEEVFNYLKINGNSIKPYFNKNLVTNNFGWKTSAFLFWNLNFKKNAKYCPQTIKILNKIPNLVSASVSVLEKNITVKPHRGDTNAIIRGHLALKIPHKLPISGFQVNEIQKSWEHGKLLFFNDVAKHTAWNHSKDKRIILIIDIIKPEFAHKKNTICSRVLSGLLWQSLSQKFSFVKLFPNFLRTLLIKLNAFFILIFLKFQKNV